MKHLDDKSHEKQPGCVWGLVHVLGYHQWQSSVRDMIQHRKYEGGTNDKCDQSSKTNMYPHDDCEAEKLLDENEGLHLSSKRSRAAKKRSLKARIKALIAEDDNIQEKRGLSFKPNLQRTYSIHHLESLDDGFGKICTNLKHPIIFLPNDVENRSSQPFDTAQIKADANDAAKLEPEQEPDVFEIFKVDKELLLKHLQDSDESLANFSRSAFGLNTKAKFSKSRSFPVAELAQRRKLKPIKLESKQIEVWSRPSESREVNNAIDRIGEKHDENSNRKHIHRRSSSLKESLDKYTRLFENSFGKDAKLSSSKSLRLTNEYGHGRRRMRSLSNADSYYSDSHFEVLDDNTSGNYGVVIAKDSRLDRKSSEKEKVVSLFVSNKENVPLNANMQIKEDNASLKLYTRNDDCEVDGLKEEADEPKKSDFVWEKDTNCLDIGHNELQDQSSVVSCCLEETEFHEVELRFSQGLEPGSRVHELNSLIDTNDLKILQSEPVSTYSTLDIENDEISDKITNIEQDRYGDQKKKNCDLDYARHLLDRSGIAMDVSAITWHASDQLFSPQLFEEVEAGWPHEQDHELTGLPGCWHHQMLFDLVNEVLAEVYDISLPYYPKALSSSCQVRPFPMGNHIIEEVCTSIGKLLNMKPEEKQSLDCIVARDLAHDRSWMNLQLETECIALDIEDMIFDELVQEVIFS